jgi:hypothetical protein
MIMAIQPEDWEGNGVWRVYFRQAAQRHCIYIAETFQTTHLNPFVTNIDNLGIPATMRCDQDCTRLETVWLWILTARCSGPDESKCTC